MDEHDSTAAAPADGGEMTPGEHAIASGFGRLAPEGGLQWHFDDAGRRITETRASWERVTDPDPILRGDGHIEPGAIGIRPFGGLPDDLWAQGRRAELGRRMVGDVLAAAAGRLAQDARDVASAAAEGVVDRVDRRTQSLADRIEAVSEGLVYLADRVNVLERRDRVVEQMFPGPPPAAPDPDLHGAATVLTAWLPPDGGAASGPVVHAECGDGAVLAALAGGPVGHRAVVGVDPRGACAWSAAERLGDRAEVAMAGAAEFVAGQAASSIAGMVLSGCTDRGDTASRLELVLDAARTLSPSGWLAVLSTTPAAWEGTLGPPAVDLVDGRPLDPVTWQQILERAGLAEVVVTAAGPSLTAITGRRT